MPDLLLTSSQGFEIFSFFAATVATASASYRTEKPRNPEHWKNGQKHFKKSMFCAYFSPILPMFGLFFPPIFGISGLFYSVAGQRGREAAVSLLLAGIQEDFRNCIRDF